MRGHGANGRLFNEKLLWRWPCVDAPAFAAQRYREARSVAVRAQTAASSPQRYARTREATYCTHYVHAAQQCSRSLKSSAEGKNASLAKQRGMPPPARVAAAVLQHDTPSAMQR
ncbi:hypothetical protein AVEN_41278-1 [Araneus ventricosus]|uniref:Uncharacterized protein n=1 Tax=Araneus ventricosus TaxID=182803 RepID=A0A4Y2S840_ARAVE|nr:hypothetical protein AVEN_41278-1 [Araneus ventricosus]